MISFLLCLLITVSIHELAHLITAIMCGMKVSAYSIGFGKPYLHKKWRGIDWRLSPIPLGGYCSIDGMENNNLPTDFLSHRYLHKFIVLTAGVTANIILACICYLINYGSIKMGFAIDWMLMKAMFTRNYEMIDFIFRNINVNFFLLQLSILNIFCGLTNLIPIPGLDGSYLWIYLLEKKWGKNFKRNFLILTYSGYAFLIILQVYLLWWIYFK